MLTWRAYFLHQKHIFFGMRWIGTHLVITSTVSETN